MEMLCVLILLSTSYWYFQTSPANTPLTLRLVSSAHGASALVLLLLAFAVGFGGWHGEIGGRLFVWLQLIPLALIASSFWLFRGPRSLHWLQLFNIPATLWLALIGNMLVTGKWL
ncbi:hypothetical protein [Pseudomonas sp. 273]|uniref:hypothetical protein n=1 Tax=Pseudomonas sp. 273 TaxID=75692 RepID=UPI0023D813DF|nr:hypothetical protein [Pseudomonas sp. 273]